jgi:hypothetical protein
MKKRLIVLFLMILVSISFANAKIVFNNDFTKFNLGDTANIEGYIESNTDIAYTFLKFYLDCDGYSQLIPPVKWIKVEANKKYLFNEDVSLFNGKGECNFRSVFNGESYSSDKFDIVDELKGNLFVNENELKLGEILEISGDILKVSNDNFDGTGIISFDIDDETYFADIFDISGGSIDYSIVPKDLPANTYNLKIEAFDVFGNKGVFDLGNIKISNKLSANAKLDKQEYLPGDRIDITGNVDSESYRILIDFDGERYENNFESATFDYFFKIRENIKSGSHALKMDITDEYGNYYEENINLIVSGIPKRLEVNVDKESYIPEDTIEIFSAVYDQGDDIYEDIIHLKALDPKKNEILNIDINSGTVYGLNLEKYAFPGSYKITAKSTDFNKELLFTVEELREINPYYDENRLKISNEGNINIDEDIIIHLNDNNYNFKLNIKPSEIESYDLRSYIKKDGVYALVIDFNGESYEVSADIADDRGAFEKLTGSVVSDGGVIGSWVIYILILVVIILLLYIFLLRKPVEKDYGKREKDFREAQEKVKRTREERLKRKPKRLFNAKEVNESDAKQFRESMVKKMKER